MSGKDPIPNAFAYEGVRSVTPPDLKLSKVDPTAGNTKFRIGTFWLNTVLRKLWVLESAPGGWLLMTNNGNLTLNAAGNKILSTSVGTTAAAGANSVGSVTLVAGTATVATTSVTANSLIVIWRQSIGATGAAALGQLTVGTITAGTSFVINAALTATATSLATTDVSVVGYMIIN